MADSQRTGSEPYFVLDSPYEIANWRPLVHWLMYIPHYAVLYVLQLLSRVVFIIYWVMIVVTGKPHRGLYDVLTMYERYNTRASGFLIGYTEQYPPFDFCTGPTDNGRYEPMGLTLPTPPEEVPRIAALNWLLAIPHFIMLMFFGVGAGIVAIIGWFAVLFTGSWPAGMRDFLVRLSNYYYRVWSYAAMVENDYPRFGLPAA